MSHCADCGRSFLFRCSYKEHRKDCLWRKLRLKRVVQKPTGPAAMARAAEDLRVNYGRISLDGPIVTHSSFVPLELFADSAFHCKMPDYADESSAPAPCSSPEPTPCDASSSASYDSGSCSSDSGGGDFGGSGGSSDF